MARRRSNGSAHSGRAAAPGSTNSPAPDLMKTSATAGPVHSIFCSTDTMAQRSASSQMATSTLAASRPKPPLATFSKRNSNRSWNVSSEIPSTRHSQWATRNEWVSRTAGRSRSLSRPQPLRHQQAKLFRTYASDATDFTKRFSFLSPAGSKIFAGGFSKKQCQYPADQNADREKPEAGIV